MSRNIVKSAFFGGRKSALSKLTQEFLPHILGSWYNSRVFWNAAAFNFHITLLEKRIFILVFGATKHFVLNKFVWWYFYKKVLFGKSKFIGQNSIMIIFFDQLFLIVLPIQKVLQKQKFGVMFVYGPIFCGRWQILKKKKIAWKNYGLRFLQRSLQNAKTSRLVFLKNNGCDVFRFIKTCNFCGKKPQGIVFLTH